MGTETTLHDVVHRELLPGARNWSFVLRRGYTLRLTDHKGGANCSALFFNAHEKLERYNMADTLKAQHTARLTKGHVCYSDMGRILVSIVEDTCGWHDPIGGISDAALVKAKVRRGPLPGAPQRLSPRRSRAVPDRAGQVGPGPQGSRPLHQLLQQGHRGRGRRHGLRSRQFGRRRLRGPSCRDGHPGGSQHLPHPLDPYAAWAPRPVDLTIHKAAPVAEDDVCLNACPENRRGFANTAIYHCQH